MQSAMDGNLPPAAGERRDEVVRCPGGRLPDREGEEGPAEEEEQAEAGCGGGEVAAGG